MSEERDQMAEAFGDAWNMTARVLGPGAGAGAHVVATAVLAAGRIIATAITAHTKELGARHQLHRAGDGAMSDSEDRCATCGHARYHHNMASGGYNALCSEPRCDCRRFESPPRRDAVAMKIDLAELERHCNSGVLPLVCGKRLALDRDTALALIARIRELEAELSEQQRLCRDNGFPLSEDHLGKILKKGAVLP